MWLRTELWSLRNFLKIFMEYVHVPNRRLFSVPDAPAAVFL